MNVLVLSNCPLVESQGSGYVILNTIRCFINLGHHVTTIPPEDLIINSPWDTRARYYRMAIGMARWVVEMRSRLSNYDLIILYGAESGIALFIIKNLLKLAIPVILHSNGLEMHVGYRMKNTFNLSDKSKWYHFDLSTLFMYCYKNVDAIINVSDYDRNFALSSLLIDSNKLYTIEPSLPDIFFNKKNKDTKKSYSITYCGSWIARKGVEIIQEALPSILRKHANYSLTIIGTGNDFDPSEHFPKDTLNQINIHPFIENKEQLIKIYNSTSIFIFPSVYESFGLVIAEAMSCQCAVVCTSTGFGASLRNNEEALVLEQLTPKDLSIAIERLIADSPLRERISLNARKRVETLKWSSYQVHLETTIKKIINNFNK